MNVNERTAAVAAAVVVGGVIAAIVVVAVMAAFWGWLLMLAAGSLGFTQWGFVEMFIPGLVVALLIAAVAKS